jgi:hypothetical protein
VEANSSLAALNGMLQDESTGFLELLASLMQKSLPGSISSSPPDSSASLSTQEFQTTRGFMLSRLRTKEVGPLDEEEEAVVVMDRVLPETEQRPAITQPLTTALERRIAEILQTKSAKSSLEAAAAVLSNGSRYSLFHLFQMIFVSDWDLHSNIFL